MQLVQEPGQSKDFSEPLGREDVAHSGWCLPVIPAPTPHARTPEQGVVSGCVLQGRWDTLSPWLVNGSGRASLPFRPMRHESPASSSGDMFLYLKVGCEKKWAVFPFLASRQCCMRMDEDGTLWTASPSCNYEGASLGTKGNIWRMTERKGMEKTWPLIFCQATEWTNFLWACSFSGLLMSDNFSLLVSHWVEFFVAHIWIPSFARYLKYSALLWDQLLNHVSDLSQKVQFQWCKIIKFWRSNV